MPDSVTDEYGNLLPLAAEKWVCEIILGNRRLAQHRFASKPDIQGYEEIIRNLSDG
jgi:hypothetical protein